jgi:Flp pilus assembly protein TadG
MMSVIHLVRTLRLTKKRLASDKSGLVLLEFAFSMPLVLMIGLYGIEIANLALTNMKVSQIALNLADNASRVGLLNNVNIEQLREVDVNDILQGTRNQGDSIDLTTNGRVIISSLETDGAGTQRIHWQRCVGLKNGVGYDSSYGTTIVTAGTDTQPSNAGTLAPTGMGDAGQQVTAPSKGGVMFVEVNYLYQPIVGNWLLGVSRIHYVASYVVRDNRDFTQIYNPSPTVARMTCDKYSA